MHQITVLIADDHALFREGLRLILAREERVKVVGEAVDGLEAVRMAEDLQPNVLLLDVLMPNAGGVEVLPKIRAKCPNTKILILSGLPEEEFIAKALEQGAKGYLSKAVTHKDLVKAIFAAHAGEIWAERRLLASILEGLRKKVHDLNVPLSENRESLTEREQEVVKWVMQGMTNKEIAAQLGISEKTVKTHLSNIFSKLKVGRRLQLLLYRITDHGE